MRDVKLLLMLLHAVRRGDGALAACRDRDESTGSTLQVSAVTRLSRRRLRRKQRAVR